MVAKIHETYPSVSPVSVGRIFYRLKISVALWVSDSVWKLSHAWVGVRELFPLPSRSDRKVEGPWSWSTLTVIFCCCALLLLPPSPPCFQCCKMVGKQHSDVEKERILTRREDNVNLKEICQHAGEIKHWLCTSFLPLLTYLPPLFHSLGNALDTEGRQPF